MRWTVEEKNTLRTLFLDQKRPIIQIAEQLGRSPASVNTALTIFGIPRQRSIRKCQIPTRITPELARIHAHVCGDGHVINKREKDSYGYLKAYRQGYYRRRYAIAYTNTNPALRDEFSRDAKHTFNLKPQYNPRKLTVMVKSKAVYELLTRLGAGKSRGWSIGAEIRQAHPAAQKAWIRAFFDDEAHFVPHGGIRVRSVNRPGLEQAAVMLRRFVPCHLTPTRGLYPDTSCYLVVLKSARADFLRLIGSTKLC